LEFAWRKGKCSRLVLTEWGITGNSLREHRDIRERLLLKYTTKSGSECDATVTNGGGSTRKGPIKSSGGKQVLSWEGDKTEPKTTKQKEKKKKPPHQRKKGGRGWGLRDKRERGLMSIVDMGGGDNVGGIGFHALKIYWGGKASTSVTLNRFGFPDFKREKKLAVGTLDNKAERLTFARNGVRTFISMVLKTTWEGWKTPLAIMK